MGRRNSKEDNDPNRFFSRIGETDRFAMVYEQTLKSEPFLKLSCGAKLFYIQCLSESLSKKRRAISPSVSRGNRREIQGWRFYVPRKTFRRVRH